MCTPCDRLDNFTPAFPGDEPVILRKHTCEEWEQFGAHIMFGADVHGEPRIVIYRYSRSSPESGTRIAEFPLIDGIADSLHVRASLSCEWKLIPGDWDFMGLGYLIAEVTPV